MWAGFEWWLVHGWLYDSSLFFVSVTRATHFGMENEARGAWKGRLVASFTLWDHSTRISVTPPYVCSIYLVPLLLTTVYIPRITPRRTCRFPSCRVPLLLAHDPNVAPVHSKVGYEWHGRDIAASE